MIGMYLKYIGSDDNSFGLHYGDVLEVDFRPALAIKDGVFAEWWNKEKRQQCWKQYSSLKAFTQESADAEPVKRHGRKR